MKLIDPGTNFNDNDAPTKTDKPQPYESGSAYDIDDFVAAVTEDKAIHLSTRNFISKGTLNEIFCKVDTGKRYKNGKPITISPSQWLSRNQSIESIYWDPEHPQIMENVIVDEGGVIYSEGFDTYNSYLPSRIKMGEASEAQRWLDLIKKLYPREADHILKWLAYKVQNPGTKINHALVLGGKQGIGKDTLIEPVVSAVGEHNVKDVSPQQIMDNYNGYVRSVILRVSEAVDMGKRDRFKFYEDTKTLIASPPKQLQCNVKYLSIHAVKNVCGMIITTNHKMGGIYIPADDRRHFVAWSPLTKNDFEAAYFPQLWQWFEDGGREHVAAFLHNMDLSEFDPKAPPKKTQAFREFVDAGRSPQDTEFATALEKLGWPNVVSIDDIRAEASRKLLNWLNDSDHVRQIPYRFEEAGYSKILNPQRKDNCWAVNKKRTALYGLAKMSISQRIGGAMDYEI
jgi:hypothetical protein